MFSKTLLLALLGIMGIALCQDQSKCHKRLSADDLLLCCKLPKANIGMKGLTHGKCHNRSAIRTRTCMVECVANETGIIENGQLDEVNLERTMKKLTDNEDFISVTVAGFKKCFPEVKMEMRKRTSGRSERCSKLARGLTSCALKESFLNCPVSYWSDTERCRSAKEFIRNCV